MREVRLAKCGECGKGIEGSAPSRPRKYCSLKCFGANRRGMKFSSDWRRNLSKAHMGYKPTEAHRRNLSKAGMGRIVSKETREKISRSNKGVQKGPRPWSDEERKHQSEIRKGSKSHFWKGGVTPINELARRSVKYKMWRESVFKRDDWTCQFCKTRGGELHADHIKPFALFKELRYDLSNGRTLCAPCHRKTDTYGSKVHRNRAE